METMTDSPHWQTALLTLDWGDNLTKLETWIRGRTFAPHWTEFDRNWLRRSSVNAKLPPISRIITGCEEAWRGGANDYWLKHPNTRGWADSDGLDHYIRLLTMIVRENTAVNAVWAQATARDIRRYFEKALVLVNCMREEWKHKGTLYEYFHTTETQLEGASDGKLATTHAPSSDPVAGRVSADQSFSHGIGGPLNPKAPTWPQDKATSAAGASNIELSGTDNFLQTLNDELDRKHIAAQAEVDQAKNRVEAAKNAAFPLHRTRSADGLTTPNRKRPVPTDEAASTSRASGSALSGLSGAPDRRTQDGLGGTSRPSQGYPKTFEDHERSRAKGKDRRDDAQLSPKRTKTSTDASNHHTRARDPPIKREREEDAPSYRLATTHGVDRPPAPTAPYSSHRPESAYHNGYRDPGYHRPSHRDGDNYAAPRHATPRMGPYTFTNGSGNATHAAYSSGGSGGSHGKSPERVLREVCPYELKDEKCPRGGTCRMNMVCVDYTRNKSCADDCRMAHVLRTCRYKVRNGLCNKEAGLYPRPCTYGHDPIRVDMWLEPERFHRQP